MSKGGIQTAGLTSKQLKSMVAGLQQYDCHIPDKHLRKITSYGEQLIPHLEDILRKTLDDRTNIDVDQAFKSKNAFKIVHVFNFLAHFEASDSLKLVLEFLSQEQKYPDYWLGDIFDEDLWEVFFKLGNRNTVELKYFLLNKKNNEFFRLAAAKALIQIALHNKKQSEEVRNIFHTLLILEDENEDFIGLIISELLDWRDENLKPIILKKLNEVDVYEGIITAEEVEHLYEKKKTFKRQPRNIFERYAGYREEMHFSGKKRKKSTGILNNIKLEKAPDSDFKS